MSPVQASQPRAAKATQATSERKRISAQNPHPGAVLHTPDLDQFRKLAEFRFQLRKFLHFSHAAAEGRGIRPQQYQLLLCVYGMPQELDPTIANVAARMLLKHNSAVELVDRTIEQGLLRRSSDPTDHRRILLRVTPEGERILASLADYHMQELEQAGPELIRALRRVLSSKPSSGSPRAAEQ
ncbi:MAG TPA: MarR family winged helix-turn-helix transcriptional regulator [Alloacidobacterium sp.]|nr:MarR family winged helix-turn-helix transcriptional regulator [Alloacidobacterium sp.]